MMRLLTSFVGKNSDFRAWLTTHQNNKEEYEMATLTSDEEQSISEWARECARYYEGIPLNVSILESHRKAYFSYRYTVPDDPIEAAAEFDTIFAREFLLEWWKQENGREG